MATFTRTEKIGRRIEFRVPTHPPWGACWVEVDKAIDAAIAELRDAGALMEHEEPSDDRIRVHVEDEAIVVAYEKEG